MVEVRADDQVTLLPSHDYKPVKNGASFCDRGVIGAWVEIRVRFLGIPCTTDSPILTDLRLECCKAHDPCAQPDHAPIAIKCPEQRINAYPSGLLPSLA